MRIRDQEPALTGFAGGSQNGVWLSHCRPHDRRLVLAESAIEALSHSALFPDAADQTPAMRAWAANRTPDSRLVQWIIVRLPESSEIVAAFEADEAGGGLVNMLRLAVAGMATASGRTDLTFKTHLPAQEGDDWNQVLQMDYAEKRSNPAPLSERTRSELEGCRHHSGRGKTDSCPG
jgi:hypothetical protein